MTTIGIIAPKDKRLNKVSKLNIFKKLKPDYIFNERHLVRFVIAYDNQNYNKIFKKNNVKAVVYADGAIIKKTPEFTVCNGQEYFEKNIMYFIVRAIKLNAIDNVNTALSIVFDSYTDKIHLLILQALKLFRYFIFVTDNKESCAKAVNTLTNEYGINIEIKNTKSIIDSTVSVEYINNTVFYKNNTIVININSNISASKEYNITMPKHIPFNVNKLALSEALSIIQQND